MLQERLYKALLFRLKYMDVADTGGKDFIPFYGPDRIGEWIESAEVTYPELVAELATKIKLGLEI